MAKPLDPVIVEVLKSFGFDRNAIWDCHGTLVVYHRVLEQIAAKVPITFDPPMVLEANGAGKVAALCVTGSMPSGKREWSIGEASPANNKNAYPFAMAEKRAKDRVILKLIGLHGLAYSEEEADEFKAQTSAPPPPVEKAASGTFENMRELAQKLKVYDLLPWWNLPATEALRGALEQGEREQLHGIVTSRIRVAKQANAA